MNFSQVKDITIPEGSVKKIEVNGATIWEKRVENWGTIVYSTTPSGTGSYTLTNGADFDKLGGTTDMVFSDGTTIVRSAVLGYTFGSDFRTTLPDYFLASMANINTDITVPSGVTSLGTNFLDNSKCGNVTLPNTITAIPNGFMQNLRGYTGTGLTIPDSVTSIGKDFLHSASFNVPLTLSSALQTIGANFLREDVIFSQNLTVPRTVSQIGDYFMYDCHNFGGILTADGRKLTVTTTWSNYMMSSSIPSSQEATQVLVNGICASVWVSALPKRTVVAPYRNLVLTQ